MKESEKIPLSELQRVIRDKLYEALPGFYWVIAEIAEMKVNSSGHCYFELTGSDTPGGKVTSRARATVWAARFRSISSYFELVTGIKLAPGITILLKATVEYHELYGLSLNIADIDASYTAGEQALKREAIIRRLKEEGVISMNQELSLPPYPRNIAVISSTGAAGYEDFLKHIHNNGYGFVFVTNLYEAVMQGEKTKDSVIEALNRIAEDSDKYDAVVLIRGGGSATDLSWFDDYEIAFHITQFPLPLLTGIGHQKDMSVADIVSWKALKTPTAVADFLVSETLEAESLVMDMASRIATIGAEIIAGIDERLQSLSSHIAASARLMVRVKKEQLGYSTGILERISGDAIRKSISLTDRLAGNLRHLEPENVLRRGFTLTTRAGKIIRTAIELSEGDEITTHFEKSKVISIVTGKKQNKL
ncbi:MAG TPA: exodeoxyribonuclease VII large subunit [Bacteroidales bacterium]|nr:exodeoxyribonuclease VII large subunit [Bacteroidales bacterium]